MIEQIRASEFIQNEPFTKTENPADKAAGEWTLGQRAEHIADGMGLHRRNQHWIEVYNRALAHLKATYSL